MPKIRTCKLCQRPRARNGYCTMHQELAEGQQRTDNLLWRSTKGQKVRAAYLAAHPYCHDCLTQYSRPVPAVEVHHIHEQTDRPDLVLDWTNMLALCHDCHGARHGKGIGGGKS